MAPLRRFGQLGRAQSGFRPTSSFHRLCSSTLDALDTAGSSTPDLVSQLSSALGLQADDAFAQSTRETLAYMDHAGLIEPVYQ